MDHDASPDVDRRAHTGPYLIFASAWAAASLFHVWYSAFSFGGVPLRSQVGVAELTVAAAAVVVLLDPHRVLAFLALAGAQVWSAILEAPVIGNHWVLAALVAVAMLLAAAAVAFGRGRHMTPTALFARFAPAARWSVLGFYAFAAFSKLNHGFFTTRTSCATFYFDETARSLGIDGHVATKAGIGAAVVLGTAMIELSVPVLLVIRRTRPAGVLVGVLFHSAIALDQQHLFSDFSSLLIAMFLLFLPPSFAAWAAGVVGRGRVTALRWAAVATAVTVTAAMVAGVEGRTFRPFENGRHLAWIGYDLLVVVLVVAFIFGERPRVDAAASPLRLAPRWLAVVPAIVVLNGLTPYLELKTGYGWNMYSNLRTVDGDSNHFLITRSLPILDVQEDLVTILSSSDRHLQIYADLGWDLPYLQFRAYLSRHPGSDVRYRRRGAVHDLAHASDDPALVADVPAWQEKLLAFRAVDQADPPRCQPVFLPAR